MRLAKVPKNSLIRSHFSPYSTFFYLYDDVFMLPIFHRCICGKLLASQLEDFPNGASSLRVSIRMNRDASYNPLEFHQNMAWPHLLLALECQPSLGFLGILRDLSPPVVKKRPNVKFICHVYFFHTLPHFDKLRPGQSE